MQTITIPKRLAKEDDLVVISRKKFEELIARAGEAVTEKDVLSWSRDARKLRRAGKLRKLA
jgi:uncharacterized ferredoxin-like protein